MDYTTLTLAETRSQLDQIAREAEQDFGGLDARQLNWRPDETRWGVGQCLEHLLTTNQLMLGAARSALDPAATRTLWQRLPVVPAMLGRLMIRSLTPTATRKMTAPATARPAASGVAGDVVRRFAEQQREMAAWLGGLDAERAERTIMVSPFLRVITYSVLDGSRLMATHDRRHMEQARRVMQMPEFPRSSH